MLNRGDEGHGGDFVAFFASGTPGAGQYRCADCGYGITIRAELPDCPMCAGRSWEAVPWSPFGNLRSAPRLRPPLPGRSSDSAFARLL
jgi:hypothetical protein